MSYNDKYTTRYPEAVVFPSIETELLLLIAEARVVVLIYMYRVTCKSPGYM